MTDRKEIERLIEAELAGANKQYPLFHSPHEAFGVLLEEVEELRDELEGIEHDLDRVWYDVKHDINIEPYTKNIYRKALMAAAEAIQVAAMCKKVEQSELY